MGKTFVASEKIVQLGEKLNLIVCQKSKIEDWINHFRDYYPAVSVMDWTESGAIDNWIDANGAMLGDEQQVAVINYDLIFRRKKLMQLSGFTLICDESGLICNEHAKRTKAVMNLHFKNIVLLSGTICNGKYEKLWSQMRLLGWKISKDLYWKQFVKVEYLDKVGASIPIVTGYKNTDRLKRKMAQYGCQFLKTDEVFDLPAQTFQKIKVNASKEYVTFRKKKLVTVHSGVFDQEIDHDFFGTTYGDLIELVGDTTLTRMLYERQLCGMYSAEKLKAFTDLLESTTERLVVFYNFNGELKALKDITRQLVRPVSIVNGEVKDLSAYEQKSDSVTFLQYQAGAMGLNLQKACRMVFFTLPLSSELYEQAKKRIHRIGQDQPCFYYQLICKGSIEEKIMKTLEMRKDYTEKLFEKDEG